MWEICEDGVSDPSRSSLELSGNITPKIALKRTQSISQWQIDTEVKCRKG